MKTTASLEVLEQALKEVNKIFNDNVTWKREPEKKGKWIHFTIKTKSNKGSGHGLSASYFFKQRNLSTACWHVHGELFGFIWDLDPEARIDTAYAIMSNEEDNWQDYQRGSQAYPIYASECCVC
tara:strand:- start:2835 stop:3206 length:372 start_codon:yes stop_codon:yes gene_type:complete